MISDGISISPFDDKEALSSRFQVYRQGTQTEGDAKTSEKPLIFSSPVSLSSKDAIQRKLNILHIPPNHNHSKNIKAAKDFTPVHRNCTLYTRSLELYTERMKSFQFTGGMCVPLSHKRFPPSVLRGSY